MNILRVYRILQRTAMAGPGMRYCLWVQGCSRHCEGCMAAETWPHDGGRQMEADELTADILATKDIEGVTFLGGEPFEQAPALARLAGRVRKRGLSVVTFTGFTLGELRASREAGVSDLLAATDLLIDGPFVKELFALSRPWVGSANQGYHFLTGRYEPGDIQDVSNQLEVRIAPNGKVLVNGMGDFWRIKKLLP